MNESSVLFQRIGFKDVIVKPEERLNKSIIMVKKNISLELDPFTNSLIREMIKKPSELSTLNDSIIDPYTSRYR